MKLHIYHTVEELLTQLADYFVKTANASIAARDRFTVALSGGSSPEKLYGLLASPAYSDKVDWTKIYFFLGDERYVPLTDKASNYKMINSVLFEPLKIPASQCFPVDTSLQPAASAAKYMQAIVELFGTAQASFDLVLLGLGDNSHTASLFPFTDILDAKEPDIKAVFLDDQQVYRISFTAPLINLAKNTAFLVYGAGKAQAVYNVLEGPRDIPQFPAQLIQPVSGAADWFLDDAAAALVRKKY